MRSCVVQRLHPIVNVNGNGSRDARQIAADHKDHAKFAKRMSEAENSCRDQPGPGEWKNDPKQCASTTGAKNRGCIEQPPIQRFERRKEWLHGEGQAVKERGDDKTWERERQGMPKRLLPNPAKKSAWTESNKSVEAKHRGWKHQRKRNNRFEKKFSPPGSKSEPISERERDDQKNARDGKRQA